MSIPYAFDPTLDLKLERVIDVPVELVWKVWTEPEHVKVWFCPKPWIVSYAAFDVRPGGSSLVVMKSPDGEEFANPGVFLDVVENERLVMTDAYTSAWVPSQKPFMTAMTTISVATPSAMPTSEKPVITEIKLSLRRLRK